MSGTAPIPCNRVGTGVVADGQASGAAHLGIWQLLLLKERMTQIEARTDQIPGERRPLALKR